MVIYWNCLYNQGYDLNEKGGAQGEKIRKQRVGLRQATTEMAKERRETNGEREIMVERGNKKEWGGGGWLREVDRKKKRARNKGSSLGDQII